MRLFLRNVEQRVPPDLLAGGVGFLVLLVILVFVLLTSDGDIAGFKLGKDNDSMYVYRVIYTNGVTEKIDTVYYHVTAQAYDYHDERYKSVDDYVQLTEEGVDWLIKKFSEEQEVMAGRDLVVQVVEVKQ